MVILIPLPQGIWEGGHDPCPSPPEKRRSVAMATPIPLLEGRRMPLSMPPPREQGEWRSVAIKQNMEKRGHGHLHPSSRRKREEG